VLIKFSQVYVGIITISKVKMGKPILRVSMYNLHIFIVVLCSEFLHEAFVLPIVGNSNEERRGRQNKSCPTTRYS
ncbi:hypothetical protein OEK97_27970, partial [Escherichia coli]|uniref:hypothetical protein n=1 Tax=Escherichia coli TaxID=562 RepID=UPI0021DA65BC